MTSSATAHLPKLSSLKRTIRRIRNEEDTSPPNPKSLSDLIIPQKYQLTNGGQPFLLYDSGPGEDRILLFSTLRNLRLMENCKHWYADGTFSTSPSLFTQIYTVTILSYFFNLHL